uniref:Uncharacterized protein n=1 Tax=Graphocephala atropunctata TaxID=36148 RepID=A0A1B6K976_9HEMI
MSALTQNRSKKLIKICPDCAMAHFAACQRASRSETIPSCNHTRPTCPVVNTLSKVKQTFNLSGDVTTVQLISLAVQLLLTTAAIVARVAMALRPVLKILVLVLAFCVESIIWVRQESTFPTRVMKGLACAMVTAILSYYTYIVLVIFADPALTFLFSVVRKTLGFI